MLARPVKALVIYYLVAQFPRTSSRARAESAPLLERLELFVAARARFAVTVQYDADSEQRESSR